MTEWIEVWIPLLVISVGLLSFYNMAGYLYQHGIIAHRLCGIRVDIVISEYVKLTLKENGYIGVWFWPVALFPALIFISMVLFLFTRN
jgi:hypothetical protein